MKILTVDNDPLDMDLLPDVIDDIRFCVLDYSNDQVIDYYFPPLIFLETFSAAPADLQIGPYRLQLPLDWSILIGDKHQGDIEHIRLMDLNDRDFSVFAFNPVKGYMPNFYDIMIRDIYPEKKWFLPKLKFGNILAVPLSNKSNPECVFIVRDINKIPDCLDIGHLI